MAHLAWKDSSLEVLRREIPHLPQPCQRASAKTATEYCDDVALALGSHTIPRNFRKLMLFSTWRLRWWGKEFTHSFNKASPQYTEQSGSHSRFWVGNFTATTVLAAGVLCTSCSRMYLSTFSIFGCHFRFVIAHVICWYWQEYGIKERLYIEIW